MINAIKRKYDLLGAELDERGRRLWAAAEASELGHGGMVAVARATGLSERTIRRGCQELHNPLSSVGPSLGRRRCPGSGRRPLQAHDPELLAALEALVEPTTRGDPRSPLRWTCKSTRKLAKALTHQGHPISHTAVAHLLTALDYKLAGYPQDPRRRFSS